MLILPGSLGINENERVKIIEAFPARKPELSSSSKVYLKELKPVYEKVEEIFTEKDKIYLQMPRYEGGYEFREDINIDISNIAPYARKIERSWGWDNELNFLDNFTLDELNDYFEAHPELRKKSYK